MPFLFKKGIFSYRMLVEGKNAKLYAQRGLLKEKLKIMRNKFVNGWAVALILGTLLMTSCALRTTDVRSSSVPTSSSTSSSDQSASSIVVFVIVVFVGRVVVGRGPEVLRRGRLLRLGGVRDVGRRPERLLDSGSQIRLFQERRPNALLHGSRCDAIQRAGAESPDV
jgi:hypothetical protein